MSQCGQQSIFDELNKFFNGCYQDSCECNCSDKLSISEDEDNVYIDAALPGIKSEEINITLDPRSRHLLIRGEGKLDRENVKYRLKGFFKDAYKIPLSNEVSLDSKIDAVSRDGVLSITLSKNRGHKPLKIDVRQT